jgi:hypothetical protein
MNGFRRTPESPASHQDNVLIATMRIGMSREFTKEKRLEKKRELKSKGNKSIHR